MNQELSNGDKAKLANKVAAAIKIINWAHFTMKNKYGSNNKDGETPLAFHNLNHSLNVSLATSLLYAASYKNGKIPKTSLIYLKIADSLHDIEQNSDNNEEVSAEIATDKMRAENIFREDEIETVQKLILGTKNYSKNGKFYQAAKNMGYLEKIIADAELAHLGAGTNYFLLSFNRYTEEKYNGSQRPRDWELYLNEMNFLNSHEYLTAEAKEIFDNKENNLIFCQEKVNNFRRGRF